MTGRERPLSTDLTVTVRQRADGHMRLMLGAAAYRALAGVRRVRLSLVYSRHITPASLLLAVIPATEEEWRRNPQSIYALTFQGDLSASGRSGCGSIAAHTFLHSHGIVATDRRIPAVLDRNGWLIIALDASI